MATIADNIAELMRIRLEMKEFAKIPDDVPFEQYGAWLAWAGSDVPAQPLMADFVNKRYSLNGVPCRFEDIFEFERLSKAWDFIDGELKEYEVGEARFSEKGMLVEPESTNYLLHNDDLSNEYWLRGNPTQVTKGHREKIGCWWYLTQSAVLTQFTAIEEVHNKSTTWSLYMRGEDLNLTLGTARFGGQDSGASIWITGTKISSSINTEVHGVQGESRYWFNRTPDVDVSSVTYSSFRSPMTGRGVASDRYVAFPQVETYSGPTSVIVTGDTPVTRLPETLTLKNPNQSIIVDADEGIIQDKGTFSGFGHIRKIEVK